MKKTILVITATTALFFASCADKTNKTEGEATSVESTQAEPEKAAEPEEATIVGTWKLSDIDLGMEVPKGKEQALEDMKKKMIAETVYTFNADGTMTFKNPMVPETPATYTQEDSKIIITDNKTKNAEIISMEELTADKLVLSSEQGGRKAVMTFSK